MINLEFCSVLFSLPFISLKSDLFLFGFDLELSSIKGSSNFIFFKSRRSFSKTFLKSIKHSINFSMWVFSFKIICVNRGFEGILFKFSPSIIYMTFFVTSRLTRFNFLQIIEFLIRRAFFCLEEFFHGINFKEMFIFSKLVRETSFLNFNKSWSRSTIILWTLNLSS